MGCTTAAVPQAKASVTRPAWISSTRVLNDTSSSLAFNPRAGASSKMDFLVTPCKIAPFSLGVTTSPFLIIKKFIPPSSSIES
jgi:hypothetical protein